MGRILTVPRIILKTIKRILCVFSVIDSFCNKLMIFAGVNCDHCDKITDMKSQRFLKPLSICLESFL